MARPSFDDEPLIGGQAVIEGVMMKAPDRIATAVRTPSGKVTVKTRRFVSLADRNKLLNIPIIRGFIKFLEVFIIGMQELTYSANEAVEEEEEQLSTWEIVGVILLSLLFAVVIFMGVPILLSSLVADEGTFLFHLADGFFRVVMFVIYLAAISRMKDVKRLFQYHGAEHKVVNCHEKKLELTVKNAKKCSTRHPRCGTSFILIILIISVLVFTFITSDSLAVNFGLRLLLLPVVMGASYEVLRLSAKFSTNPVVKALIAPGLALQGITTREPDDRMLEVSIQSMKAVL